MVRNFERKAAGSADINSVNASVSAATIWSVRSVMVGAPLRCCCHSADHDSQLLDEPPGTVMLS